MTEQTPRRRQRPADADPPGPAGCRRCARSAPRVPASWSASMAVSLFASGMWVGRAGLAGDRARRRAHRAVASWPPPPASGMLLSVLVGGVAADRLPRRALLIVVEAVRWSAPHWPSGCWPWAGCCSCGTWRWSRSCSARPRRSSSRPTPRCCPRSCPPTSCSPPTASRARCGPRPSRRWAPRSPASSSARSRRASRCWCRRALRDRAARAAGHAHPARPAVREGSSVGGATCARASRYLFRTGWLFATLAFATLLRAPADRPDRGAAAVRGARPDRQRGRRLRARARRLRRRRGDRLAGDRRRCGCRGAT